MNKISKLTVVNLKSIDNNISYMIYLNNEEYRVKFHTDNNSGRSDVLEYIDKLDKKEKAKISKYIEYLRISKGYLDEPYSKHIKGKIRELRVDFGKNRHRILYFTFIGKNIVFLNAFLKKTPKTPLSEIEKAEKNYFDVISNPKFYE